jgi:putative transposase
MRVEPPKGGQKGSHETQATHSRKIIRKLRDADVQLANGASVADVSKKLGVSENTFHRWRAQYGGMRTVDAKRLRELEKENARLKKIVADQAIDLSILREVSKGNF